jgi:hypothetical protein
MQRVLLLAAATAALFTGCGGPPRFQDMRTPSGEFCSDMTVFPAGEMPDREFHRLGPIQSEPTARTEAERLQSLRKAACLSGGDGVIEAVNEEVRLPDASYGTVASGTAVVWTRRPDGETKPLTTGATRKAADGTTTTEPAAPDGTAAEPVATTTKKEPTPVNTSVEAKQPPPPASATASATAPAPTTSATGTTTKTKTTTKTTTSTKK